MWLCVDVCVCACTCCHCHWTMALVSAYGDWHKMSNKKSKNTKIFIGGTVSIHAPSTWHTLYKWVYIHSELICIYLACMNILWGLCMSWVVLQLQTLDYFLLHVLNMYHLNFLRMVFMHMFVLLCNAPSKTFKDSGTVAQKTKQQSI